jgi:hypothetical protein
MPTLTPRIDSIETSYPARKVSGDTTGTAVPAGYIGEVKTISRLQSNALAVTSNVTVNIATTTSMILTPGVWTITGAMGITTVDAGTSAFWAAGFSKTSAALPGIDVIAVPTAGESYARFRAETPVTLGNIPTMNIHTAYVVIAADTPYYLVGTVTESTNNALVFGYMTAVRIA